MTGGKGVAGGGPWIWGRSGCSSSRRSRHYPGQRHLGTFHFPSRTMWIGRNAFRTERLLRYVVLHELAHGWQSLPTHLRSVRADMRRWGRSGMPAIEAQADCIAALRGARPGHYWDCPADARALAARRLAGDRG